MTAWQVELPDPAATARLGALLAPLAQDGDVIALSGDLGMGKTAFARAFIAARVGAVDVPSPTFNLVLTYEPGDGGPMIWHFDFYRLEKPGEVWELGLEDALADGISVMEWPERIGSLLPDGALRVMFAQHGQGRLATVQAPGAWADRLAALAPQEQWREL